MHEEVLAFLERQVEETKRMHEEAKQHFWHIAKQPSGLPDADKSPLFRSAIEREKAASEARTEAVRQLDQYMLDGTVPYHIRARLGKIRAAGGE